ncbi:MAG: MFS transporter, partial [Peptococcaceae bacterium]|nr:MFS transporter [Peptococcaceae bacterium]
MAEEAVAKTGSSIANEYDIEVSFKEQLASGCMNCVMNFRYAMGNFMMIFMTDVALINPALIGVINMINSLWDAINDPLIGSIADNTLTPKGQRYTPYLLFFIPVLIMSPLGYIVWPGWAGTNAQAIYVFALGFIGSVFSTLFLVPYEALVPSMTSNAGSRASIQSTRLTMGFMAQILCSAITLP